MAEDEKKTVGPRSLWEQAREQAKKVSEAVAANAAELADAAVTATQSLQESEVFQRARQATGAARERIETAAADVQERAQQVGQTAHTVITTIGSARGQLDDEVALSRRFREALTPLAGQLDCEAQAVAIGSLARSGIGVAEVQGTELFYLRPDGPVRAQLRVSTIRGRVARLAAGASTGAYLACFYGERDLLSRPMQRRGGDVGVMIASIGFFRASAAGGRAGNGWMVGLSAGVGIGIPILSDFVAFELDEQPHGGVSLEKSLSEPIEALILDAPDRLRRRQLAYQL